MPEPALLFPVHAGDILALEEDLTACAVIQVHDGAAQSGLSAAGLAHDAQRPSLFDLEGDAVHRVQPAGSYIEMFF